YPPGQAAILQREEASMYARAGICGLVLSLLTASAFVASGGQDATKSAQFSSKELEQILTDLKVSFKKRPMPGSKDRFLFDYEHNKQLITLVAGESSLLLQARFKGVSADTLKQWNASVPASRAFQLSEGGKLDKTILERSVKADRQTTANEVQQFLTDFHQAVIQFSRLI